MNSVDVSVNLVSYLHPTIQTVRIVFITSLCYFLTKDDNTDWMMKMMRCALFTSTIANNNADNIPT